MPAVIDLADHQPEPSTTLHVLIAPGDPAGYAIAHPYVDGLWLPVVGPSAIALLRLVDRFAETHPDTFTIEFEQLGRRIGIGGGGESSRVSRTIDRLCKFRIAARVGEREIVVPLRLPPLSNRQLDRLPPYIARLDQELRASTSRIA